MCQVAREPDPRRPLLAGRLHDPLASARGTVPVAEHLVGQRQTATTCFRNCWNAWSAGACPYSAGPGSTPGGSAGPGTPGRLPVITDYDEDLLGTFSGPVIWVLDDTHAASWSASATD